MNLSQLTKSFFESQLIELQNYADLYKRELEKTNCQITVCQLFLKLNQQRRIYVPICGVAATLRATTQYFTVGIEGTETAAKRFDFLFKLEGGELNVELKDKSLACQIEVCFTSEEKCEILREFKFKEGEMKEFPILCECFSAAFLLPESPLHFLVEREEVHEERVLVPTVPVVPEVPTTPVPVEPEPIVVSIPIEEIQRQTEARSDLEEIASTPVAQLLTETADVPEVAVEKIEVVIQEAN